MSNRASLILLALLCAALLFADHLAWRASHLAEQIGSFGGFSGSVDGWVRQVAGEDLDLQRLREDAANAVDSPSYLKAVSALDAHLQRMGLEPEREELAAEVIDRFPQSRDPVVIEACWRLLDFRQTAGDHKATRGLLEQLQTIALTEPPDTDLMQKVATRARRVGVDAVFVHLAEACLTLESIPPGDRLPLAIDLAQHYRSADDSAGRDRLARVRRELEKAVDLTTVIKRQQSLIRQDVRGERFADALALILENTARFPEQKDAFRSPFFSAMAGVGADAPEPLLQRTWDELDAFLPLGAMARKQREAVRAFGIMMVLRDWDAQRFEAGDRRIATTSAILDDFGDLRPFFESERWIRSGRKGTPPTRLASIPKVWIEVAIDGELKESHYQSLQPLPGPFYIHYEGGAGDLVEAGNLSPAVWLFHNGAMLYLGARIPDPYISSIRRSKSLKEDPRVQELDSVEFLIDVARQMGAPGRFVVAADGARFSWLPSGIKPSPYNSTAHMFGRLNPAGNCYEVEMMIPCHAVGLTSFDNVVFRGDVLRTRWLQGAMRDSSPVPQAKRGTIRWAPIADVRARPEQFALFQCE